ncbi:Flap endonuclease GEN 1 [Nymphon striatum]|nr:Flap endonuclease GEN 1 [Nymphon striatum]
MGVKGLWSILEPASVSCNLEDLKGQTLAVDLGGWVVSMSKINVANVHLRNLFHRTVILLHHQVNLIFILEGTVPKLKYEVFDERIVRNSTNTENKESGSSVEIPRRSQFNAILRECEQMLTLLGCHCIKGAGEAEALCALLDLHGLVDGCITDDIDAFLYGAKVVYRNFTLKKCAGMQKYCYEAMENKLQLNREKLVALAVLIGCDYLPKGVPGVGIEKAVKLVKVDTSSILKKFEEWTNAEYGQSLEEIRQKAKKGKHCTNCQHLGKVTSG